jgi:hypothetical protein
MVEETATESLLHVGYSPALPNDVIQALNPVLVDRQMYYDFNLDNDIDEIRSAYDYLKPCPTRNYFSNFQIGLSDLGILWCILATGILIALLVSIYHCITSKIRKKKGKFVFSGTRSLRNKRISKVIGISTLLFTGVSILSIRYLYSPSILKRTNDAKPRMKEILSEKRLKSEWSKIIKQKARWRFNLMFRMAMLTISREAKKSKNYKKDPSKLLQPIFKKTKLRRLKEHTTGHKHLGLFYSELMKDVMSKLLQNLGVLSEPYPSRLKFTMNGTGQNMHSVILVSFFYLTGLFLKAEPETEDQKHEILSEQRKI